MKADTSTAGINAFWEALTPLGLQCPGLVLVVGTKLMFRAPPIIEN
jgi:hypothetical protein